MSTERKSNIPQWMWEEYDLDASENAGLRAALEHRFMPYDEFVRKYLPDLNLPTISLERWMSQ